jgi:hypothetical protein
MPKEDNKTMSVRRDITLQTDEKAHYVAYDGGLHAERWRLIGVAMLYHVLHPLPEERNIVFGKGDQIETS